MRSIIDLLDLAKRPVMLPMICDSLTLLEEPRQAHAVTAGSLYRIYTDRWLSRESWRLHMSEEAGRHFLEDLALFLHNNSIDSMQFAEITERFPAYFPEEIWSPERDIIGNALRSASFLTNDESGEYRFTHRSFLEYFLAERLIRAFRRSHISLAIDRFPSKVTDSFVLDLLREEPRWQQELLKFARFAEAPILRYLAVYLINRLADEADRDQLVDHLCEILVHESIHFVTRELLVTLIGLGSSIDTIDLEAHLRNPIPQSVIETELKDYYGSLEEARRYLRRQLEPGSRSPLRLFYLISLASICTEEDIRLLNHYEQNGTAHEITIAAAALVTLHGGKHPC